MSSGNPMGLSEISHFGTFQRVGGKAGGFISKKFFHPSSFRNQEKLWKAQTADEREVRKQTELEKRREEERQVEALRKQMYLAGQGKATDILPAASTAEDEVAESVSEDKKSEQKLAIEEEKRRRALLKQQGKDDQKGAHGSRPGRLAASRYPEDVFVLGHCTVWGSWYSVDEKQWGFACCKVMDRGVGCPAADGEAAAAASSREVEAGSSQASSSKRPRTEEDRGGGAATGGSAGADASASSAVVGEREGGLQTRGDRSRGAGREHALDDGSKGQASLMDSRLLEAAERRNEKRKAESERREERKASGYLAVLLQEPKARS